jgi:sporulation-control protein spo0M
MGLLSAFGVGGGKLSIEPVASHVQAGGTLTGKIVFTGGKRPQNVTNIQVTLNCNVTNTVATPQGPQQRTNTTAIVPP